VETIRAKFVTKYGDVYWGPVEIMDGVLPPVMALEQQAGEFHYDHEGDDGPVYQERG
jgi:hypothetical protein